jgi:hypothetical protein
MCGQALPRLSPARSPQKAVTPSSVKVLMMVEAGIIGFLSYWVMSEYAYNAYFRGYADQILFSHVTTYTAVLGLGIGLAGSAIAATLYKSLRRAKVRLETVTAPRIRGAVEKVLSNLTSTDAHSASIMPAPDLSKPEKSGSSPVTAIVPVPESSESKKTSD